MAIHVPSASHPISHGKKENPFPDDFQTKGGDLSTLEDLAIGLMNLVSLEEHFYFSFAKTKETKYLDYMQEIRG
ncbi:MAG: hypothetical protein U1C71_03385, partial [archaeon]|nr:hypothetical protein [archaeon]